MDMTIGEFFNGLFMGIAAILLGLLVAAVITVVCGGLSLAFWNMWAMLGWLPMIPTAQWIPALFFFSVPGYLKALVSFLSSKS